MDHDPCADEQRDDECPYCAIDLDARGNCPGCIHREEYHPDEEPGWICNEWVNHCCIDDQFEDVEDADAAE